MSCGLTAITSVSRLRGRLGRGQHVDAVGVAQLLGPVGAAGRRDDLARRDDARAQQARGQRLAHLARAENGDHGGSLPSGGLLGPSGRAAPALSATGR